MRASTATAGATAAWLVCSSACGGTILLGNVDDTRADDAGSGGSASHSGTGMGPVVVGGDMGSTPDSGSGSSSLDSSTTIDEPDASIEDAGTAEDVALGPGYTHRNPACGYTQVDPQNCGACGHDCQGGACQNGACVPLPPGVLASGLVAPVSVAVDATNVYWLSLAVYASSGNGFTQLQQLLKCAKTGCKNHPTPLCSMGPWSTAPGGDTSNALNGIVSDGTNVYWAALGGVLSCPVDGSHPQATQIASPGAGAAPWNIGVNATSFYSGGPANVFGCPTSGCIYGAEAGGPTNLWAGSASAVAIDGANAYWVSSGAILSCALGGCNGTPSLLTSPPGFALTVGQIALDQANVYWNLGVPTFEAPNPALGPGYTAAAGSGPSPNVKILKCAKAGCNGQGTAVVAGLSAPMGLTTDGINVYFTDVGNGYLLNATNVGRVAKCPVAGCSDTGTTIADKLENPRGVAVDATNVYWADFGSGSLDGDSLCGDPSTSTCSTSPLSVDGRIMVNPK